MTWWQFIKLLFTQEVAVDQAPPMPPPPAFGGDDETAMWMLCARLNLNGVRRANAVLPYQHLSLAKKSDGSWVVFVMVNDKPLHLDDSKEMFPSDKLVNALRLLLK